MAGFSLLASPGTQGTGWRSHKVAGLVINKKTGRIDIHLDRAADFHLMNALVLNHQRGVLMFDMDEGFRSVDFT